MLSRDFQLPRNCPELSNYLVNTLRHLYVYHTFTGVSVLINIACNQEQLKPIFVQKEVRAQVFS